MEQKREREILRIWNSDFFMNDIHQKIRFSSNKIENTVDNRLFLRNNSYSVLLWLNFIQTLRKQEPKPFKTNYQIISHTTNKLPLPSSSHKRNFEFLIHKCEIKRILICVCILKKKIEYSRERQKDMQRSMNDERKIIFHSVGWQRTEKRKGGFNV